MDQHNYGGKTREKKWCMRKQNANTLMGKSRCYEVNEVSVNFTRVGIDWTQFEMQNSINSRWMPPFGCQIGWNWTNLPRIVRQLCFDLSPMLDRLAKQAFPALIPHLSLKAKLFEPFIRCSSNEFKWAFWKRIPASVVFCVKLSQRTPHVMQPITTSQTIIDCMMFPEKKYKKKTKLISSPKTIFISCFYFCSEVRIFRAIAWSVPHKLLVLRFTQQTGNDGEDLLTLLRPKPTHRHFAGLNQSQKKAFPTHETFARDTCTRTSGADAVMIVSLTFVTWNFVLGRHDFVWEKWKRKHKYLWISLLPQ